MATTSKARVEAWIKTAPGKYMNPDHAFGFQCVDVVDDYGQFLYGKDWRIVVKGVNGAKDLLRNTPTEYWSKIVNDPRQPNQIPQRGDVVVYPGRASNLYLGHTAVVESADKNGVHVLQQNGWTNRPTERAYISYKSYLPSGWLRPHVAAPSTAPTPKPKPPVRRYVTVRPGWGLSNVAKAAGYKDFGSPARWAAIARLNGSNNWQAFNNSLKSNQKVRVQ